MDGCRDTLWFAIFSFIEINIADDCLSLLNRSMEYELLTRQQVADILNVHPATLDRMRQRGEFIEPSMIGRIVKFRSDRLKEWLAAR